MAADVSVPKRPLFKPAEVCTIAGLKPYVLRSWEAEFPSLGGHQRQERRSDVSALRRRNGATYQGTCLR